MDKAQAISRLGMGASRTNRFANINAAKNVWWVDVPFALLRDPEVLAVNLVLYDHRSGELHHLRVASDFIESNIDQLHVRDDVEKVSLELSTDLPGRFTNVAPIDSGISFASFLVKTV